MTSSWKLDLRGHEFKETDALFFAILGSTSLQSLNKLTFNGNGSSNLKEALQHDRC